MSNPVSSIPNIGPATEAAFLRAGVTCAEDLRAMGADDAYLCYLNAGYPPHFIGYYALVMGLQGRPWNDCHGAEKAALRKRFDALKTKANAEPSALKDRARLEAALDALGVIAPVRRR